MLILIGNDNAVDVATASDEAIKVARFVRFAVPRDAGAERQMISCLAGRPAEGLFLTGVRSLADVEKAAALLRVAAAERRDGNVSVLASIDTPEAALGIAGFNRSVPGLAGLILDEPTLRDAMGMVTGNDPLAPLRAPFLLAAKVCGALALLRVMDMPLDASSSALIEEGFAGVVVKP